MGTWLNGFVTTACLAATVACSNPSTNKEFPIQLVSYTLEHKHDIEIPIDDSTSFESNNYTYFEGIDDDFLITQCAPKNSVQIYSLSERRKVKEIRIPRNGPGSIRQLHGMTFVNFDSIFVFDNFTLRNALMIDSSGNVRAELHAGEMSNRAFNHASMTRLPTIFFGGSLFLFKFPDVNIMDPAFFGMKVPFEFEWDISSGEIMAKDVYWPDAFVGRSWGWYTLPSRTVGKDGLFVYSFCIDDELLLTNFSDVRRHRKARSRYYSDRFVSLDGFENEDSHYLTTDGYGTIVYDRFRDVYYRVAGIGISNEARSWDRIPPQLKPFSIIILSSDFRVLGETIVEPVEKFNCRDLFVAKEGLFVSAQNPFNPGLKEDFMVFSLFTLQHEK